MRKFFSLIAAVLFAGSMMAEVESVDFSAQGYENQQAIESYAGTNFTVTFGKGTNSNAPKYYTSGTAIRCYGANTFTVASESTISQIVLTYGASDGTNEITAAPGTFATDTWTGSANSVVFTIGGTSGNRRIKGIEVTFDGEGGDQPGGDTTIVPVDTTVVPVDTTIVPVDTTVIAGSVVSFTKDDFAGQGTANSGSEVSATKAGVTFTFSKGYCAEESLRCYAHGALSITATSTIQKINFTTTGGKTGGLDEEVIVNANSYTVADLASQARFTEIAVTLGEGGDQPGGDTTIVPVDLVEEYYLVGNFNGWQALEAYKLVVNPGNAAEMMISGVQLAAEDSIKVLGILGETTTWYPDNADNYVIAEDGLYDIYFRADGQGGDDWYYHYFYVAEVVAPVISLYTCAQVQANEATEAGELNEVQVLFINGGQFYVRDASGMTLIYKSNHGLTVGDLVSGIVGTSTIYNNITPQFQPSNAPADWTIIPGDAPVYDEKTEAPVVTDINGVYNFKNVSFSEAVEFTTAAKGTAVTATIGEGTITIFNNYKKAFSFEAEKAYDIIGVVTIYQNNPQIYFISAEEHVATAIDNTAVEGKAVKFFENGQLVIIKNGVRYNAQGTRL